MPLISIIIPVYNVGAYLRECLDSIVKQLFKDYEAILIDDGSTDNSHVICDEYAERYPQLRVIHQENCGVSSARNVGLDVSKGDWIWFVDADDYVKEDSLELLSDVVDRNKCDIVFHGLYHVYNDGRIEEEQHSSDLMSEREKFLLNNYCYQNGMLLFKADIIKKSNLRFTFGMKMAEDLEFQYKYLLHCERPVSIPYSLYYIRERENSASRNITTNSNNLQGNKVILANILAYVQPLTDKGLDWLGIRMAERTKSLMQAAFLTSSDTKDINRLVRGYVKSYRSLGFAGFDDLSLRLASIDVRIYYFLYKLRFIIKRLRK